MSPHVELARLVKAAARLPRDTPVPILEVVADAMTALRHKVKDELRAVRTSVVRVGKQTYFVERMGP